jgi:hypothetical protein
VQICSCFFSKPGHALGLLFPGTELQPLVYPELFALVGPNVPDYRGVFLRGTGGNAAALGVKQDSAVKIGGDANTTISIGGRTASVAVGYAPGDASSSGVYSYQAPVFGANYYTRYGHSDASYYEHTYNSYLGSMGTTDIPIEIKTSSGADETRPVNVAVRYLIRARP